MNHEKMYYSVQNNIKQQNLNIITIRNVS